MKQISFGTVARVFLLIAVVGGLALSAGAKTIGKNPGKIKGRWLKVDDPSALQGKKVFIGDVTADIQWKKKENEAPIDEDLLAEKLREELMSNLQASSFFTEVLDAEPEGDTSGVIRLDCSIEVEPGSRAARYVVGFGAGKSRSILEIRMKDPTGREVGLYHGYGVGSGMGFKLAGGSARKMSYDDVQENTKKYLELLGQL